MGGARVLTTTSQGLGVTFVSGLLQDQWTSTSRGSVVDDSGPSRPEDCWWQLIPLTGPSTRPARDQVRSLPPSGSWAREGRRVPRSSLLPDKVEAAFAPALDRGRGATTRQAQRSGGGGTFPPALPFLGKGKVPVPSRCWKPTFSQRLKASWRHVAPAGAGRGRRCQGTSEAAPVQTAAGPCSGGQVTIWPGRAG